MSVALIILIASIEAGGHGLILPVLPSLLRIATQSEHVEGYYAFFSSIYLAMQFIFASSIGSLSDRFGRRPVLLCSLLASGISYLGTAAYPSLALLFLGSLMTGAVGTTLTILNAVVIDISDASNQARRMGFVGAAIGISLVAGPALGGLLSSLSPRIPYLVAAASCAVGAAAVWFLLPETTVVTSTRHQSIRFLNPFLFGSLRSYDSHLLVLFTILVIAAQIPQSLYILYGESWFGWSDRMVGLFLAAFGLLQACAQLFLVGPMIGYLGERRCIALGTSMDALGYLALSCASQSWQAFALLPFWCIGGIVGPALQVALARMVASDQQAQLQGTLTSIASLITIPAPFVATMLLKNTPSSFPGLVWVMTAAIYTSVPILITIHKYELKYRPIKSGLDS